MTATVLSRSARRFFCTYNTRRIRVSRMLHIRYHKIGEVAVPIVARNNWKTRCFVKIKISMRCLAGPSLHAFQVMDEVMSKSGIGFTGYIFATWQALADGRNMGIGKWCYGYSTLPSMKQPKWWAGDLNHCMLSSSLYC
ncbi:hypothetical protein AcV7_007232 [Taiwanofungus camphoratus]|nr:hypothetical protein AcV7_007232 [Antrodia cinnamomea]